MSYIVVSSGKVASGTKLYVDSMYVQSGGTALATEVSSQGVLYVSGGGLASSACVQNSGKTYVASGAKTSNTNLKSGGSMFVSGGGYVYETTINVGGTLILSSGGTAAYTNVKSSAVFDIKSGAVADHTYVYSGGKANVCSGASAVSGGDVRSGGSLAVCSGGKVTSMSVKGGILSVSQGGVANNITVSAYGSAIVNSGLLNSTFVNSSGYLYVNRAGSVTYARINNGGSAYIDGHASFTVVSQGGILRMQSSGCASNTDVRSGGEMWLLGGASALGGAVSGASGISGKLTADSGCYISGFAVDGGSLVMSSAASAYDLFAVNGGKCSIADSAFVSVFLLNPGGSANISGTVTRLEVAGGTANVYNKGLVSSAALSSGTICVNGGKIDYAEISGSGQLTVQNSGSADHTLLSGGTLKVQSGCSISNTSVYAGTLQISGTANSTLISKCSVSAVVASGGCANNNTVESGVLTVNAAGKAISNTLKNGGVLDVSGTAGSTTLKAADSIILVKKGGIIDKTILSNGSVLISSGAQAGSTTMQGGSMVINDCGKINHTIINGGTALLLSGGSASDTTVNSQGVMQVEGTADGIVITSGGSVCMKDGAQVWNSVMKGGVLEVVQEAAAFDNIISGGTLDLASNGTASNTTVYSGGTMNITGGSHTGSLYIQNGAQVIVGTGASIDFTVVNQVSPETALIRGWDYMTNGNNAVYTATIGGDYGTFLLASEAENFTTSVTVRNAGLPEIVTLSVGETKDVDETRYTLSGNAGTLSLTIGAVTPVTSVFRTVTGNFTGTGGAFQLTAVDDIATAEIRTATGKTSLSGTIDVTQWEVIGANDFNGNGTDGLLWLEKATGYVYMQYDMTSLAEVTGKTNCLGVVGEGYALKGTGDFTGNGIAGALLQGPAFGDPEYSLNYGLPVWAREDDGSTFNGWLGALVNTWQEGDPLKGDLTDPASINANNYQYAIVGVGDFNGDGRDDVMLQNTMPKVVKQDGVDYTITGSGDVFTFLTGDKAAIIAGASPTVCYAGCATDGWEVLGFGDFNADGIDDTLLSDGTGLAGWKMANGQRQDNFWFGNLGANEEFAGIADFNADGTDDILVRNTATETLTAWTVKDGAVTDSIVLA